MYVYCDTLFFKHYFRVLEIVALVDNNVNA